MNDASDGWPAPSAIIAHRFERRRRLGTGATSTTFVAFDRVLQREVALKVLRSIDEHPRWERELAVLAELTHPGLPTLIEHGRVGAKGAYVAMRLQPGVALCEEIHSPIASSRALSIALSVCEPLAYLHDASIVHRDLKPEHILLAPDASASIVDLGLASIGHRAALTAGSIVGTLGYLPPEQLQPSPAEPDPRWDVFSLGCVLYRCLSGHAPFEGRDASAILARTLAAQLDPLDGAGSHVDPALAALVHAMLDPHPQRRPADARAVSASLRALQLSEDRAPAHRVLAVILGRAASPCAQDATPVIATSASIDRATLPSDARIEALSDGTIVATIGAQRADQRLAVRAVQTAILLADQLPTHGFCVALGDATHVGRLPRGAAFDLALSLLERASPARIVLDAVTALYAGEAFAVRSFESAFAVERGAGRVVP